MKVKALNKATGEVVELPVDTPEQIVQAWQIAQEYDKTCAALKDQLKKLVPTLVGSNGLSEPFNGYQFRQSHIQRMNYDKTVMREVLDPDLVDVLTKPDKPAIDRFLKDLVADDALGVVDPGVSIRLRETMIAEGNPYTVTMLERIS